MRVLLPVSPILTYLKSLSLIINEGKKEKVKLSTARSK